MKLYLQGLASAALLLALSGAVAFIVGAIVPGEAGALAGAFCVALGSVFVGYLYRRWNGPLLGAHERGTPGRLFRFILGAGTLLGLLRILGSESPLQDANPLVAIGTVLLSVPISGMGFILPMFIGSLFYRETPSRDAAADDWVVAVECPDSTGAQIAVSRLQAEAIPARVQNLASLPGLEPGSRVLVPASMTGRAREALSPAELGESELEELALRREAED